MKEGSVKNDRTGTGTKSIFGHQMRFDLSKGFPCITTKKLHLKSIIHELLLWFLAGDTNTKYLNDNGVRIWDEWADDDGNLGAFTAISGGSWPSPDGNHIDQISQVINDIKSNPNSRRLIVSAWNVSGYKKYGFATMSCFFQFYVNENKLSLSALSKKC